MDSFIITIITMSKLYVWDCLVSWQLKEKREREEDRQTQLRTKERPKRTRAQVNPKLRTVLHTQKEEARQAPGEGKPSR